jgi:hypothetical protein
MTALAQSLWVPRRRLALTVLLPLVAVWFVLVGQDSAQVALPLLWYAVLAPAVLLGAAVLATYVPVAGRGLDLGCTPCAMLSGLTLVGASIALHTYAADLVGPLVAGAVLLFGLTQRMSQPATCPAPVRERP